MAPLFVAGATGFGQEPRGDGSEIFTSKNPREFLGPGTKWCEDCHSKPIKKGTEDEKARLQLWALKNEKVTWKKDNHSKAFDALITTDLAKQIGQRLGQPEIHRDKRCLACHVGMPMQQMIPVDQLLVSRDMVKDVDETKESPRITAGVSCESCHGPSGNDEASGLEGWISPHTAKQQLGNVAWPYRSPQHKLKYGYYDVRSPISRTKMCVSCHIGSVEQGKVITHDMYSAGHPPLPGFETVMFTEQQPRHWRKLVEKPAEIQKAYLEKSKTKAPDPEHLQETRDLLVSALTAASESLRLAANLANAKAELPEPLPKPRWPEMAQFACYNCHHDLKASSWRQQRGFKLMPGRPSLHEWPSVLAEVALDVAGEQETLANKMKPLVDELNRHPFGRGNEFSIQARLVSAWLNSVAMELAKTEFTPEFGDRALQSLARRAGKGAINYVNYNSARQMVWAFDVVYRDIEKKRSTIATRRGWYRKEDGSRTENLTGVQQALAAFDESILLDLVDKKNNKNTGPSNGAPSDAALIAKYDPHVFQQRFSALFELYLKERNKKESAKSATRSDSDAKSIRR